MIWCVNYTRLVKKQTKPSQYLSCLVQKMKTKTAELNWEKSLRERWLFLTTCWNTWNPTSAVVACVAATNKQQETVCLCPVVVNSGQKSTCSISSNSCVQTNSTVNLTWSPTKLILFAGLMSTWFAQPKQGQKTKLFHKEDKQSLARMAQLNSVLCFASHRCPDAVA